MYQPYTASRHLTKGFARTQNKRFFLDNLLLGRDERAREPVHVVKMKSSSIFCISGTRSTQPQKISLVSRHNCDKKAGGRLLGINPCWMIPKQLLNVVFGFYYDAILAGCAPASTLPLLSPEQKTIDFVKSCKHIISNLHLSSGHVFFIYIFIFFTIYFVRRRKTLLPECLVFIYNPSCITLCPTIFYI